MMDPTLVWERFRDFNAMTAKSPYNERVANHQKTSTQGSVSIYEWGDSIYVAAWGTYLGNFPPTVIFTKSGSGNTVTQQIQAINDIAYAGPALTMIDPATNMPVMENVYPWRASVRFDLETGSEIDPQTPGSQYIISALALIQNGADAGAPSFALRAGQFQPMVANGDLPRPPRLIAGSRVVTIANPLALTSRGLPGSAGDPNTTGWTSGFPVNNSTTPVTEILGNGNLRAQLTGTGIAPLNYKDLVAPMGLINHGNSGAYNAVDNNGKVVPALLLSDRSNVYKRGRHINNVRVAKNEMRWGWNPADNTNLFRQQTGNVMNPLPWEQFPNTVPNVSQDYPDIDRSRATFKVNGVDMSVQGIRLEWPTIAGGVKTLQPTNVDMQLDVPAYTAANVNTNYFDINGGLNTVNNSYGLLYPISTVSGADVSGNANLRGLISPSAGYTGTFLFFMASSPDGNYHGSQARDFTQTASTLIAGREDTFRQLHVSVGVPPDMTMRVEEETVDIGAVPHGFGYIAGSGFGPSYAGGPGVRPGPSGWETSTNTWFLPVTISNKGNVNLVNVRMSKIAGDYNSNPANPNYWIKMQSDQVDPLTGNFVWGPRYNFLNPGFGQYGAAGNIGIASSLDAPNFSGTQWEQYFWPYNVISPLGRTVVDYVTTNFPGSNARMPNWVAGQRPTPSIHKPRPSTGPQTMSIPDVAFGDPLNVLGQLAAIDAAEGRPARDTRPKVSVAIPLTQPAGTYTTTITPFEDHTPEQWRNWVQFYRNFVSSGSGSPFTDAPQYGDNDGILNFTPANPAFTDGRMMAEGKADPGFRLKVQVIEGRLTNGTYPGSLSNVDNRGSLPAFGANVQPAIFRNPNTGLVTMYWSSNRLNGYVAAPQSPDVPWYLNYSSLNPVIGTDPVYGPVYDWKVAFGRYPYQWWNPVPFYASQYPDAGNLANIFPSQLSDLGSAPANTGLVAGTIIKESVRHSSPAIAQDDDPTKSNAPVWLFWQGKATKTTSAGGQSQRLDTRTLYTQLNTDGTPASPIPFSILNDPSLPKFNTKPLIMTHQNGKTYYFLFWNGGADGRSRIYFNYNVGNPLNVGTNPNNWSVDTLLPTPGALEWQSNPSATHRVIWTAAITGNLQKVDVIDVTYTGTFGIRRQPETLLTRYAVLPKGNSITLQVIPLPQADNETAMRDGSTNVWSTKDITYVYRDSVNKNYSYVDPVDGLTKPFIQVFVYNSAGVSASTYPGGAAAPINGYNAGTNSFNGPTFDNATGRLYFSSTLGGQVVIDPQSGTVNFQGVSPKLSDRVVVRYIPQTMRLNVTRTDSNAEAAPAGWANDPGFISKSSVAPTGANTQALSFIDRMQNPHRDTILPALAAGAPAPPVARLWTVYRKSSNNNSGATIYYKTMRLMARLPRGVLRDYDPATNTYSIASNITISGNLGPVEVDWVRGRLYFTEIDEGSEVKVTFNYSRDSGGNKLTVPTTVYRVAWGDEISTAVTPGDQTTNEVALPISGAINEGMVSAFKDPYQDKVWIVWSSTRKGTTDLYYLTLAPQFYTQPAF